MQVEYDCRLNSKTLLGFVGIRTIRTHMSRDAPSDESVEQSKTDGDRRGICAQLRQNNVDNNAIHSRRMVKCCLT